MDQLWDLMKQLLVRFVAHRERAGKAEPRRLMSKTADLLKLAVLVPVAEAPLGETSGGFPNFPRRTPQTKLLQETSEARNQLQV